MSDQMTLSQAMNRIELLYKKLKTAKALEAKAKDALELAENNLRSETRLGLVDARNEIVHALLNFGWSVINEGQPDELWFDEEGNERPGLKSV
jgi:hypothetical protein